MKRFSLSPRGLKRHLANMAVPLGGLTDSLMAEAKEVQANSAWAKLGRRLGFDPKTVMLADILDGFDPAIFYAEPVHG